MLFLCFQLFFKSFYYLLKVGRQENVIGWYHSHPGYGCWLSDIDASTPFVAIIIDPVRTISAVKVCLNIF